MQAYKIFGSHNLLSGVGFTYHQMTEVQCKKGRQSQLDAQTSLRAYQVAKAFYDKNSIAHTANCLVKYIMGRDS